jgi:hypothetical protein
MASFRVLTRIEKAIKNSDKKVLDWADFYCAMRLQISKPGDHQAYWQGLLQEVRKSQSQSTNTSTLQ